MFEELTSTGKMVLTLMIGLGVIALILGLGNYIVYQLTNDTATAEAYLGPAQDAYSMVAQVGPLMLAAIAIFSAIGLLAGKFMGGGGKE